MPVLFHGSKGQIDYLGALLIVAASVPLLLALSLGGQQYAWLSPMVFGLFAVSVLAAILFVVVEGKVAEPILHLELFRNAVFTWANIAGFFSSMSFLSVVAFLPLFMQLGQGIPATSSGFATLPLMIGLIVTATVAGRLVSKTGRYKPFMLAGGLTVLIAILLLGFMERDTSLPNLAWRMGLLGIGLGPLQSLFGVAIQNAAPRDKMGVVTSANQFFRQIGSTVGVALFGALLTSDMNAKLADWAQQTGQRAVDLSGLRTLAADAQGHGGIMNLPEPVRMIVTGSVTHVILLSAIIIVIALLATLKIPEVPMRSFSPPEQGPPPEAHL
jgi:MFS family permease